jgi:hypothetical protein
LSWLIAGLGAELALLVTIRGILPAVFDTRPAVAALVQAVFRMGDPVNAIAVQMALAIVGMPVVFVWAVRPGARVLVPDLPWWITGAVFGSLLGLAALSSLAFGPPVGEIDGFTFALWPGLTAHVIYGLTLAGLLEWRKV